ncbi:MAG: DUF1493 family protein [Limnothrix sp.]
MVAIADIYTFISDKLLVPTELLEKDTDLYEVFDIKADACAEFVEKFAKEFKVDLESYLWYFHHGESGLNIGRFWVKPPYERVSRIPVTPQILRKAATKKRWPVQYPEHTVPKRRWDMIINRGILFFVFFYILQRFGPILIDKFS